MTDEEKKAIEIIKFLQDKCIQENGTGMMTIYRIDDLANAIKILLNLIENQYNEIEELKKYEEMHNQKPELDKEIKDKMIKLMSEHLTTPIHSKKDVIKYFENKAKESGEIDDK